MSIQESRLQAIADAIRGVTGKNELISANNFPTEINDIGTNLKEILDGTLKEYKNPPGVTNLAQSRFYQFNDLGKVDLTGITFIGNSCFYQCKNLQNIIFDENLETIDTHAFNGCKKTSITELPSSITLVNNYALMYFGQNGTKFDFHPINPCYIGPESFKQSSLQKLSGEFTYLGFQCFNNIETLEEINIKINGSMGYGVFDYLKNLKSFKLDPTSNIDKVEYSAFGRMGWERENPQNNIFEFDLRNSTFKSIPNTLFNGNSTTTPNSYFNIQFPITITSVGNNVFRYTDNFIIYFSNETPPTLSSSAFTDATNYKVFVPYKSVQAYRDATNWAAISANIYGFASENQFALGDELPLVNDEGNALIWYADDSLTTPVTSVADASKKYYAVVGV